MVDVSSRQVDGFYALRLTGERVGGGILVLMKGVVVGADQGGVFYDGEYALEGGMVKMTLRIRVPAGLQTVLPLPPSAQDYVLPLELSLPRDDMEMPLQLNIGVGVGQVGVKLTRLRDLPG